MTATAVEKLNSVEPTPLSDSPNVRKSIEVQLMNWGSWARGGKLPNGCMGMHEVIQGQTAKAVWYHIEDALETEEILTTWQLVNPYPGGLFVRVLKIEYAEPKRSYETKAMHIQRAFKEPCSVERYHNLLDMAIDRFWTLS